MSGAVRAAPIGAAIATIFLWAGSFLAIRYAVDSIAPMPLAAARFAIAGLAGSVWLAMAPRVRPVRADLPRILLCGLVGIALYNILLGAGEQHVGAGVAAFVVATQSLFAALASWLLEGKRPNLRFVAGCCISAAGLALVAALPDVAGSASGMLYCITAASLSGIYFVIQRPLVARLGPLSAALSTMVAGGLILFPWAPGALGDVVRHPDLLVPLAYLAIFASVLAYFLWMVALADLGAARASQFLFLMAPVAAIMEWSAGLEPFRPAVVVGGVLAVAGLVVASKSAE
ncbi:DMT family transporter [Sphingopyxis sp. JAI128]|uniref:DMT family transporter n=1 Tax=Sphingopyxis sp. JAI128 TaxID=2723066 RepID=UPI0016158991|nr:EamA family transporter [Sphingopyxis sp. JAI128]MBB6426889.1 drug/metabolite transporter (DMT)-like permease [Sphingopyxis sp. JAI128]